MSRIIAHDLCRLFIGPYFATRRGIAAHREIAHGTTRLLATDDQAGWERAIMANPGVTSHKSQRIPLHMTKAAYYAELIAFLGSLTLKPHATPIGAGDRMS